MPELICAGCDKSPEDLPEYDDYLGEHITTRTISCQSEEGTLNRQTGQFLCNLCYIKAGMPSGPRGWVVPADWVRPW